MQTIKNEKNCSEEARLMMNFRYFIGTNSSFKIIKVNFSKQKYQKPSITKRLQFILSISQNFVLKLKLYSGFFVKKKADNTSIILKRLFIGLGFLCFI